MTPPKSNTRTFLLIRAVRRCHRTDLQPLRCHWVLVLIVVDVADKIPDHASDHWSWLATFAQKRWRWHRCWSVSVTDLNFFIALELGKKSEVSHLLR